MEKLNDILSWLAYNPSNPLIYQSVSFFTLFAVFYCFYALFFKKQSIRNGLLLLFSLYFYYKLSGLFVGVMIFMAASDYLIGRGIASSSNNAKKTSLLILSLLINVGSLIFFKYTNFFIELYTGIAHPGELPLVLKIVQPIGISYFVFKSLTYVFDIHREVIEEPEKNFFHYLLYVSYFPNILAGPITKARDLLPLFRKEPIIDKKAISIALFLISLGFIKKILVADYIAANLVDRVFESPQYFTGIDATMASYGALIQLFFDFAGYTDIVVGISFLLGFPIKHNFNQPFKAENISGFWRRWHITLYEWLNEYVFQPLAFSWRSWKTGGVLLAVFITFFISGLWHGPNLTFVVWGLLHGLAIVWDTISTTLRNALKKIIPRFIYSFFGIFITFHFLVITGILLKSKDIDHALAFAQFAISETDFSMFSQWLSIYQWPFIVMVSALFLQFLPLRFYDFLLKLFHAIPWFFKALLLAILFIVLYQFYSMDAMPFIYIVF